MMNRTLFVSVFLAWASLIQAEIVLPAIISDQMVLQQGVEAPVWGWADPGEEISVEFAGQHLRTRADEQGKWKVAFSPLEASAQPRGMRIQGKNRIELQGVLVGEVWLAAGQSNMKWTFRQLDRSEVDFARQQRANPLVRGFSVRSHLSASLPLDDTIGSWRDAESMVAGADVSAVGFFFAHALSETLGVPVAFLETSWGAQKIERFIPHAGYEAEGLRYNPGKPFDRDHVLNRLREMEAALSSVRRKAEQGVFSPLALDTRLYGSGEGDIFNAMIAPLTPYAIRGAIWYQGESNRGRSDYFDKLRALSTGWSQAFRMEHIPIHQVQIAPHDYSGGKRKTSSFEAVTVLPDTIWTAQYRAAEEIPGMTVVPSHDTGISVDNIHPPFKREVGRRLAAVALHHQYQQRVVAWGPRFDGASREGTEVVVRFEGIDQGLTTADGKAPSWFELSADGTAFHRAEARIRGDEVVLSAPSVPQAAFVRLGWDDTAIPNLEDANGWPVSSFPAKPVTIGSSHEQ